MAGYIGPRSQVVSSTSIAKAQDFTATDTTPEVTIVNNTHEDTDGGREGKVIFKGQQSGGEESTLAEIQGSHDGTADDEKGDLIFKTNDGSDGASPTEAMRIDSAQNVGINAVPKATHADADVVRFGGTGYLANWEDAEVYLSENMYQDTSGAYKYLTASHASLYSQTAGKHQFRVAGSGSADAAITFNTALEIDNDGNITQPTQPAFLVQPTSNQNDIPINGNTTVVFGTEVFDVGSNFASNVFTAPVTGKYQLNVKINFINTDIDYQYINVYLAASNRSLVNTFGVGAGDVDNYQTVTLSTLMDMDASDQAWVYINLPNQGTAQMDVSTDSTFSGYLVA